MEGPGSRGWWDLSAAKRVSRALWSNGELAILERNHFQRTFDQTARVIPEALRKNPLSERDALEVLLLRGLAGHGWATASTLAATWRLSRRRQAIAAALDRLASRGAILPCALENPDGPPTAGWIRPEDLELAARLTRVRPRPDRGVLLSPFDPLLWDRARVRRLFEFDQLLEIFKPAKKRVYGYYCLPVLAGERLVARFDLKAKRKQGVLRVLSLRFEGTGTRRPASAEDGEAARVALARFATGLRLTARR